MSGITTATVIAGVGAAASAASAIYTLTAGSKAGSGNVPSAADPAATQQVNQSTDSAMSARTQLLETAGGAAGSPLAPGQVGNNNQTIFGN
jgi:hypothetical protein